MNDRPKIVAGTAGNETIIADNHGSEAAERAASIFANVRAAHMALRKAATPTEMRDLSAHHYAVMRNAARAALGAGEPHRAAIRGLLDLENEIGIVRMIDDPSLLEEV